ncbi:Zinc finger protein 711 [Papilio xuthus]|uniref:Zinc finger protein 711 n=1 Tax=Papilio xuthus TaxID=66420 RepID=A0A194Q5Y1_PAPXU|nr:Zinc finger protein 711 [Papilio xuthus]
MTYSCKLCSYSGKTVKYLSRHTKKVHTEPTISCNVCDKKFHFQCNLKQHLLVHTDLKPYLCTICDYACRDSSTLRKHKDRHLGIVKRYQCELCPRLKHKEVLEETDFKKEIENMELFEVEKQEILSDIEHEETNIRNHRIGKNIRNTEKNHAKELNSLLDKATMINKNVDLIEKIKRINVTVKIDKKAKENAEKHIQKLLDKSTRKKEMKELEETRQMYNERIRQAINSKPRKGPVIKFIKINNNANENNESQNNDIQSQFNDAKINDNEIVRRNNKLKINTHQCYVCFKLFETKPKLIEHCIEHFDVCCDVMLKKCPLCDYVTKLNLSRHMKLIHKINIQLPYTRFKDKKHNNNGSRYYYDINNKNIDKIEIIPSVKNLNKIESMKIDKKRKIKKSFSIDKKKLIKKGNEWIVGDEEVKIKNDYLITNFNIEDLLKIKVIGDDYLSKLKKLSHIAKNKGEKMLFPCENCEKICQTLSALKLHTRKHNPNAKPFKKKLWKNKINGKEIEKNTNRYEKPKPILNKHKCDKDLKDFYENNIKGGDIEFWQFLKIYNKISKENITEFSELYKRTDFGIHYELTNDELIKKKENKLQKEEIKNKKVVKKTPKFSRVVKMSKKQYLKRMEIKNKLRQNISNIIC